MQNTLAIAIITFALLAGTLSTGLMASQSAKAQGITNLTNTQPPSTDKRQHTDLTITKGHNPASPNIVGLAGNRTNPGNTTSTSKATGLRITLHKIYITGRTLGGGGNSTVDERSGGGVNSTNPFNNGTVRLTPLTSSGSGNVTNQTNSAGVAAGITQLRPPAGFVNPMQNSTITANARAPGSTGNVTTSPCTLFLHQSGRCATVGLGGKAGKPPGNSTGLGGKAGKPPGNNTNPNNTTNPTGTVQLNPLASSCGGNTTNPGNTTRPHLP